MRNFVQEGGVLTLIAPYAVTSGQGLLVGSIFGVATADAAISTSVETILWGVAELTKLVTDVVTVGLKVYWDNTNKRVTISSAGNTLIGVATVAAGNGATVVKVRLNGSFA